MSMKKKLLNGGQIRFVDLFAIFKRELIFVTSFLHSSCEKVSSLKYLLSTKFSPLIVEPFIGGT